MWTAAHLFVRIFTRMNDGKFCALTTIDRRGEGVRIAAIADNGRVFDCLQTEPMMEMQRSKVCRGLNMPNVTWLTFFEMIQQAFVDRSITIEFASATAAAAAGGQLTIGDGKGGKGGGAATAVTGLSAGANTNEQTTTSSAATGSGWYRNSTTSSAPAPIASNIDVRSNVTPGGKYFYSAYGYDDGDSAGGLEHLAASLTSFEDPDIILTVTVKSLNQLQSDNRTTQIVFPLKQTKDSTIVRIASDITSFIGLRTGDRREMERVDDLLRNDRVVRNDTITTRECFDILSGSVTALHCEIEHLQAELAKAQLELERRAAKESEPEKSQALLKSQKMFEEKCSTDALLYYTEDPLRGFSVAPIGACNQACLNPDAEAVKRVQARLSQEQHLRRILHQQTMGNLENTGYTSTVLGNNYYLKTPLAPPRELSGENTEIIPPGVDPFVILELRKTAMMNVMPQDGVFSVPIVQTQQNNLLSSQNGGPGMSVPGDMGSPSSPVMNVYNGEYGFKAFASHKVDMAAFLTTTYPSNSNNNHSGKSSSSSTAHHNNNTTATSHPSTQPATPGDSASHQQQQDSAPNHLGPDGPSPLTPNALDDDVPMNSRTGGSASTSTGANGIAPNGLNSLGYQGPPSSQIVKTIKRDTDLVDSIEVMREISMEHVELIQNLTDWLGDWKFNAYHVEALCAKAAGAMSSQQKFTTDPKKISAELPLAPPGALFYVGYLVFLKLHLMRQFSMSERKVVAWLRAVEMGYRQSGAPFHSSVRAADVLQAIYCLIAADTKRNVFNDRFALILVLSAILSHYRHPGNLDTLPQGLLDAHGPSGALQRHHVAAGYALFEHTEYDILDQVSDGSKRLIHEYVGNIIVSSDLAVHDTTMSTLRNKLASMELGMFIQSESCLFLSIILKLATVVFTARECEPFAVAVRDLLAEARGDRTVDVNDDLKRMSMLTMQSLENIKLVADEESISSLLNLINTIALPLFSTMGEIFPSVRATGQHILANKTYASSLRV